MNGANGRLAASPIALLLGATCTVALFGGLVIPGSLHPTALQSGTVEIRIHHSRFIPSSFVAPRGATVTFVIRNTDPIDHEFILGDDAVQARHEKGTEQAHGEVPGEVTVPAKSTRFTTFTFTSPGKLVYACHLPGHFAYGMKGTITVR